MNSLDKKVAGGAVATGAAAGIANAAVVYTGAVAAANAAGLTGAQLPVQHSPPLAAVPSQQAMVA